MPPSDPPRRPEPDPQRRSTDGPRWRRLIRENGVRLWLALATGLAAWSLIGTNDRVDQQAEGRAVTIEVTCAVNGAIIDAGRQAIGGAEIQPPELRRNLERLGLPPEKQRKAASEAAARQYARKIAEAVEKQAGVKGIIRENGTIDCDRLLELSKSRDG